MSHEPSGTELVFLKTLWEQQPLSARELHEACEGELGWSFSSTRTTLKRMQEKKLIVSEKSHGLMVYRAQSEKISTLAALMRDFMKRVIELDGPLPVAAFHDSKLLSRDELAELEALLDDGRDQ